MESYHLAPVIRLNQVDGSDSIACAQHPVEGGGCSATLQVAEDGDPRFEACLLFDHIADELPYTTQFHMTKLVSTRLLHHVLAAFEGGAFGHHDDAEVLTAIMTHLDRLDDLFYRHVVLGHQNQISATGDPSVHGDPPRVTAHHLDDHDPIV